MSCSIMNPPSPLETRCKDRITFQIHAKLLSFLFARGLLRSALSPIQPSGDESLCLRFFPSQLIIEGLKTVFIWRVPSSSQPICVS